MLYCGYQMSKLQVLITGSTGFIGRHFIKNYGDHYQISKVNLRTESVDKLNLSGVQTVLHLAALVHQMQGAPAPQYFGINHNLTMRLARKAKADGVGHFIYMSTTHVFGHYGNMNDPSERLNETSPCDPTDAYGQSKLLAEENLRRLESDTFKISIVRSPLVYGPGGKGNLNALKKLISVFPFLPFRYPANRRSLIYVENLVYFLHLLIQQRKPGLFLPQDLEPISIQSLVELVATSARKKVHLFSMPKFIFKMLYALRPTILQRLYGTFALDSTRTNQEIGYKPLFTTVDGLKATFQAEV